MPSPRPVVVVLAAGEGKRMRSALPKVLHTIAGRAMLDHVLAATAALDPIETVVVVGHGREQVIAHLAATHPAITIAVQLEQLGTGDAVRAALEVLGDIAGPIVVTAGDEPLLEARTLLDLLHRHVTEGAAGTVLTTTLDDPTGFGRIVRNTAGAVNAIVEERDASDEQRAIREINTATYVFDGPKLGPALAQLGSDNAAGELYLTDVIASLSPLATVELSAGRQFGVNDRAQLAKAAAAVRERINDEWMRTGVTIVDPTSTWIDVSVSLEPDAAIEPGTQLRGTTRVAAYAIVGPDSTLVDCVVETGAHVRRTEAYESHIGAHAQVGPFSYLRPGSVVGARAKVGAYVEVKNSVIGDGSKVPHLSYVGDATIGVDSNIGAATVFVNYDGRDKHRTVVGDRVRIGSDTMLVAPVEIGDDAYTAAGSVIISDVPDGALGVARAKQRNVEGWTERRRNKQDSASGSDHPANDGEQHG